MCCRKMFYCLAVAAGLLFFGCKETTDGRPVRISDLLSFTNSAAGHWQVGYSADTALNMAAFRLCSFADNIDSIFIWHPGTGAEKGYPYTGQNTGTVTKKGSAGQWALRLHQLAMEASNTGQYSMLRFVPPATGRYRIKAVFEGVHAGLSSTDVHVLLNDAHLFDAVIEGYGGDTSFHTISGAHPSAVFENIVQLKKTDRLTFAVGYGANKTHFNDTTGLMIIIELL